MVCRRPDGASSWPEPPRDANDPEAWRDLRFVADMRALAGDGRIDPALVDATDWPTKLPSSRVLPRESISNGGRSRGRPSRARRPTATMCSSFGRWARAAASTGADRHDPLDLESDCCRGRHRDRPAWPVDPSSASCWRAAQRRTRVFVSNLPAENSPRAHSRRLERRADGGASLRRLLQAAAGTSRRTGPSAACGRRVPGAATGAWGPVICPPAFFTPQLGRVRSERKEAHDAPQWQELLIELRVVLAAAPASGT